MDSEAPESNLVEKREQWIEALLGDDPNSIFNRIERMTWNAASFQVINEARRHAPRDQDDEVRLNGLMHSLLNRCFFETHMMGIRRLTDASYPLEGPRGVYSLGALLEDMKALHYLFQREAMFEAEGLEYDYEAIRQKFQSWSLQSDAPGGAVPADMSWSMSQARHAQLDRLCGVPPDARSPEDTVGTECFYNLEQKIAEACNDVCTHVSKFIAHSATPHSRECVNADEVGITLEHLWDAHRSICQVTHFLAIFVLGNSCPEFLATPQYDQFKYMDQPLIEPSLKPLLQEFWHELGRDFRGWSQYGLDDYEEEFDVEESTGQEEGQEAGGL